VSAGPGPGPGPTVRFAGIPIRIEPAFILVLGLLGFAGRGTLLAAIEWIVLAGISILAHELGHAAVYRRFGIQPSIRLWSFGGLTYGEAVSPARSIVVSLAGPATGLVIGVVVLAVSSVLGSVSPTLAEQLEPVVADLLYINIGWSLFNLLPVLPLDGGNVASAVLRAARRDTGWATNLSLVVAGVITVAALLRGQSYIALVGVFLMAWNWRVRATLREIPQSRLLARAWNELYYDPSVAIATARAVAAKPVSADIKFEATEIMGWAALASGSTAAVRERFSQLGDGTVGSRAFRACARVSLDGNGVGMAEALAAAYDDRPHLAVMSIASRLITDHGLLDTVIGEADELAEPASSRSLICLEIGLHDNGRFDDSVRIGKALVEQHAGDESAFAAAWIARSLSLAGDDVGALAWLRRAVDGGMPWSDIAGHEDFASLANNPAFEAMRSSDSSSA